jgi:hypothetical protein|tara:strand:- start:150 stop:338 length:189 start_codon:yes stop_codon:yes gene_type:complete
MNAYDYPTIMIALNSAIDERLEVLNSTCYALKADHNQTTIARAQRLQLMAVKDFIEMRSKTL